VGTPESIVFPLPKGLHAAQASAAKA
jgi:hypothetical protein